MAMSGPQGGEKPTKVLFVCLGNICRSPSAEAVFKHGAQLWCCIRGGSLLAF
jgi:hypothetical protein